MYWFTNDIHVYCYVQMYNILYHESAMLVKWYHIWNTLVRACGLLAVNKTLESWILYSCALGASLYRDTRDVALLHILKDMGKSFAALA